MEGLEKRDTEIQNKSSHYLAQSRISVEVPFPNSKRKEKGKRAVRRSFVTAVFCLLFMDEAYFLSASSWPALSWMRLWNTGQEQPLGSPRGLPHRKVTQMGASADV